jgi:hypothetical protein
MSEEHGREVPVTFAEGVRDDVASLMASLTSDDDAVAPRAGLRAHRRARQRSPR